MAALMTLLATLRYWHARTCSAHSFVYEIQSSHPQLSVEFLTRMFNHEETKFDKFMYRNTMDFFFSRAHELVCMSNLESDQQMDALNELVYLGFERQVQDNFSMYESLKAIK